jgi:2-polyprenyl-3-methyl-5-hydroxy-6-metoxy-1,4-benzoquinol methylase
MPDVDFYYDGKRQDLADSLPTSNKDTRVLEIGCADGGFRSNFDASEYWGVECVEEVAVIAKERLNKVLIGTFDDVYDKIPDDYFDLVVCNDVIEHMIDHDSFFKKIKVKLKPDGKISGSIPNVRYLWNLRELLLHKDWEYQDSGILDKTHLRFFTLKSLERTFNSHNYKIEILKGINSTAPRTWLTLRRKKLLTKIFIFLLGKDTQYLQFYFVISKNTDIESK